MKSARRSGALRAPFMLLRSLSSRRTVALVAALALLVFGLAGIASGQSVDCNKPTIHHVTINQGTDEYAQGTLPAATTSKLTKVLAWGKDTIVRPYLTLSCSSSPNTQTTDAELTVSRVDTSAPLTPPLDPFAPITAPFGSVTTCCTPAADNNADPKFLLAGPVLSIEPPTAPTALRFSVTVRYLTSTGVSGQVSAEKTAVVGKKANSLQVLVVPMGDKHNRQNATSPQWGSSDTQSLQTAFAALQRMAPVASGIETLSAVAANAGIRWQLAPTMLDLGKGAPIPPGQTTSADPGLDVLQADGKFCGTSSNFDKIKTKLVNGYYNTYNAANPAKLVDVVVGVVSPTVSLGIANGCNDGQAAAPGTASWARITPTTGGSVLTMEVAHNLAIVPTDADGDGFLDARHSGWHSSNTEADTLGRAYNLTTRSVISSDRTVMRTQSAATNDNTLFEPPDWAWAQCKLGAFKPYPGSCGASAGFTGAPASSEDVFQIRGTIHKSTGAADLRSNVTGGAPITPEEDSGYFLTYVTQDHQLVTTPEGQGRKFGLPVSFGSSDHHSDQASSDSGLVEGRFAFTASDSAATRFVQVWKGQPSGNLDCGASPSCLYEAPLTRRPEVTRIEITPTQWQFSKVAGASSADIAEGEPNLSFERNFLTYIAPNNDGCWSIFVLDLTSGDKGHRCSRTLGGLPITSRDEAARSPAMSPDNSAIAFTQGGNLLRVEFSPQTLTFGATTTLYECVRGASGACVTGFTGTPLQAAACCPVWSPTLTRPEDTPLTCTGIPRGRQWLAFEVGGDLYRMFPFCDVEVGGGTGASKPQLLTQNNLGVETPTIETQPTISDCDRDTTNPDTCASGAGTQPQFLAYERRVTETDPRTLWTLDVSDPQDTQKALKTSGGDDILGSRPSWGGELVAYDRNDKVFFINPDNPQPELVADDGAHPSLVPGLDDRTMAMVRSDDVYLGTVGSRRDITMIGTDDTGSISRTTGLLLLHCAGTDVPIAGLAPQRVDGEIVAYTLHNYDMSLACEEAPVVGFISDTFLLSGRFAGPNLDSIGASPVAQFISPTAGSVLSANAPIPLEADAWGADDAELDENQLQLSLRLPGTSTFVDMPEPGGTFDVVPSQFGRTFWTSGTYKARVVGTDDDGETAEAFTTFEVRRDQPLAVIDFEPNTLFVPSSGHPVTVKFGGLTPAKLAAAKVARITEVGGLEVPACITVSSGCVALESVIKNGEAKFHREALTNFMKQNNLVGGYVAVVVDGCSSTTPTGAWACGPLGDVFSGVDPTAPVTKPVS